MAFDLSTATPVSSDFDLSSAQPVAKPKPVNYTMPDGSMHTLITGNLPAGAIANGKISATDGMSTAQLLAAGAGKAPVDLARGAGQWLGLESRQDVADSRDRDADLMATGAGKTGNIAGMFGTLLSSAFVPGANTMAGAALIGALSGALQPSTSSKETLGNTALGGALGPVSLAVGRGVGAAYQAGKSALEPLFAGGQQRIAARSLQSFAGTPQEAADAVKSLTQPRSVLPGVQPTTAELANNAGLAQFERSLRNNPDLSTTLTARNQANRGAMTQALTDLGGTDSQLAASTQARASMTAPAYERAGQQQVPMDSQLQELLERPSMQQAWKRAQQLAGERGETLTSGQNTPAQTTNSPILSAIGGNRAGAPFSTSMPAQTAMIPGKSLQYLRMGLNDLASTAEQRGIGVHEESALSATRAQLGDWITENVPQLRFADKQYAQFSQPVNQMQIGRTLKDRLLPALSDFGNNTRLNSNSFANAVRNGDQLASQVSGNPGATLAGTLSAPQMTTVQQIGEQLARRANADELGRAVGSNTGQNLVSQNMIRQFLGPLGLPQSLGERAAQSTLGQTMLRPMQWVGSLGERGVMGHLADAALNPQKAAQLLMQARQNPALARMLWQHQGLLNAGVQGGLLNPPQQ